MKERECGKLSNKAKILGILTVCLIFVCICTVCLRFQDKTDEISFDRDDIELKTAVFEDGVIRSKEVSDDYTFTTKPFILPAGTYLTEIVYMSSAPGYAIVQGNNDCTFNIDMPVTYGEDRIITDKHLALVVGTDK